MPFLAELWSFPRVRKTRRAPPTPTMMAGLGGPGAPTQGSAVAPFISAPF